jgi:hypothetical protein
MPEKKDSLKAKNLKYVVLIVLLDVAAIWVLVFRGDVSAAMSFATTWEDKVAKAALGSSALTLTGLLVNSLLPSDWKAALVFWKTREILPGFRAFTSFAEKDPRIDLKSLERQIGPLPTEPAGQNRAWYKLLKKHESSQEVAEPHQYFLLFRDIASISVISAVLCIAARAARVLPTEGFALVLALFAVQYLVTAVAARNCANRLVSNVLAIASLDRIEAPKEN